eukprot:gene7631-8240_t
METKQTEIHQEFYNSCFSLDGSSSSTTDYQHRVAELIRIPEFLPYRRKDFHLIIAYTNGVSLKAKRVTFPLSPHHQLRIKSRDSGFGKIAVRKSFFSYLAADSYASPAVNQKSFVVIDDATQSDVPPQTPEQLTYIDMVVSQESQCFVPSFIPSFTSYMTMRLKRLQENKVDSYNEVSESIYGSSYSYRDWGF